MSININELFFEGMTKSDVDKAFAVMHKMKQTFDRIAGGIRPVAYLAADVERHDLTSFAGIAKLKQDICASWTCREIDFFRSFLHGGWFIPDSRQWKIGFSGISTKTCKEDQNLESAWRNLLFLANAFIGAAAVLGLRNSKIKGLLMMTDEGDGLTLWDMTIYELVDMVSNAKARKVESELLAKLDTLQKDVYDVKVAVTQKIPTSKDYAVSCSQLAKIIAGLGAKAGVRIIQRWEQYLRGDVLHGTKPPLDYSLYTRISLPSATAWAQSFAAMKSSKLRTKISFEALTGGRN